MDPPPHVVSGYDDVFVARVLDDALASGHRACGIAGLQGSGKSTLCAQVAALAARRGHRVAALSIDDFYLDRPERMRLARATHPLLATRGPPGTHDVALACRTLDALAEGSSVALPRFDKLSDRCLPVADWPLSGLVDLILLEGWCLCAPPEPPAALDAPVNALERDEDRDGTWRRHGNAALARDYPPLWERIGRMLFLQAPGFEVVPGWRWQQEQALQALHPGRETMDRVQVARFVQHYERVSRQALRTLPGIAGWTVALDADRMPLD